MQVSKAYLERVGICCRCMGCRTLELADGKDRLYRLRHSEKRSVHALLLTTLNQNRQFFFLVGHAVEIATQNPLPLHLSTAFLRQPMHSQDGGEEWVS